MESPTTYRVRIEGLPPKKDGSQSMWNKPVEVPRLIALRHAVLAARGSRGPLASSIRLRLTVHVGPRNDRGTGDLDNFITGICDGLMAAAPRSKLHEDWSDPGNAAIHPGLAIGIVDDSEVVEITARKVVADEAPFYELELTGEDAA